MQRYNIRAGLLALVMTIPSLNVASYMNYRGATFQRTRPESIRRQKYTPIEQAAMLGNLQQIQEFHAAGHDLNQRYGKHQFSLLYLSIANRKWNVVRYLLEAGADAHGTYAGFRLFALAIQNKCPLDICQKLLEQGIGVNQFDGAGATALHKAAKNGYLEGAKFLLEQGANPNALDDDGSTPLHKAAFFDHSDIVSLLLAAGAEPRIKNSEGRTPREVARTVTMKALLQEAEKTALIADLMADETRPQDIAGLMASFIYA